MDNLGMEFLDLSDVDELEKSRLLSTLKPTPAAARFPWYIGVEKHNAKGKRAAKTPLPQNKVEVDPIAFPSQTSLVHNTTATEQHINAPVQQSFYNPVPEYYAQTPVHVPQIAEYANFDPYLPVTYPVKQPVYYGVPPQPIFIPHSNTTEAYYAAGANSLPVVPEFIVANENWKKTVLPAAVNNQQSVSAIAAESNLSAETPVFTPKGQMSGPDTTTIIVETPTLNNTPVESINDAEAVVESKQRSAAAAAAATTTSGTPAAVAAAATATTGGSGRGGKSWASLFSGKAANGGGDTSGTIPNVNGVIQSIFPHGEKNDQQSETDKLCPIKHPKRSPFVDPDCYRMGEFLLKYIVEAKTISLQPRGLINQSNYCYINSILQALIACPPLYNLLNGLSDNISSNEKRKPTPVIDSIEYKHLPANMRVTHRRSEGKKDQKKDQGIQINTDIPFQPVWIYKTFHGLQSNLVEGRQEDAEEFLGCLLNKLSDEMLELIKLVDMPNKTAVGQAPDDDDSWQVMGNKNKGSLQRKTEFDKTPITDIFGGSLKSRINRQGGHCTENIQPFFTLPLNIENVNTVSEALEVLTTKHELEGLTSENSNEQVDAQQQVMFDELPVVLILHLKCFDFKWNGCTKIVKALKFPIDLKIDKRFLSSKTANAKEKQYKLFAIVYHDGKEATKGHYVTDAFHVGYSSWLRYDDASVKPVAEETVLNPEGTRVPYLLFYRRSDTIRSR